MKIKFGSIIVAGSGKIGGHVASKNRSGAYLRTKVTPTNPQTPAQSLARALLASLSVGWAGLTPAQRASFDGAVSDFATTDIFGDIKNPSGVNLYVKLNANLARAGIAPLINAPSKIAVPFAPLTTARLALIAGSLNLTFANSNLATAILSVRACAPQSQGKTFVKSEMRVIYTGVNGAGFGVAAYTAYVAKFGVPASGANVFISVQPIVATGQTGAIQQVKATVATS